MSDERTVGIGFLVLDTETTGLPSDDPIHEPYEIAWRTVVVDLERKNISTSMIRSVWLTHSVPLDQVSTWTLEQENFHRWAADYQNHRTPLHALHMLGADLNHARIPGEGRHPFYQVGANPGFDRQFLDRWTRVHGVTLPLRHRMWDTDNLAAQHLDELEPLGLEESMRRMVNADFKQSHTAADDVHAATLILRRALLNFHPLLARNTEEGT